MEKIEETQINAGDTPETANAMMTLILGLTIAGGFVILGVSALMGALSA